MLIFYSLPTLWYKLLKKIKKIKKKIKKEEEEEEEDKYEKHICACNPLPSPLIWR